jgi:hypothetical protein
MVDRPGVGCEAVNEPAWMRAANEAVTGKAAKDGLNFLALAPLSGYSSNKLQVKPFSGSTL